MTTMVISRKMEKMQHTDRPIQQCRQVVTLVDSVMSEMTVQLDSDSAEIMLNEEYVPVFS